MCSYIEMPDIFGRSTKTSMSSLRGERGIGFNMLSNGNYDMQGKVLSNAADGTEATDLVTQGYCDLHYSTKLQDGEQNAIAIADEDNNIMASSVYINENNVSFGGKELKNISLPNTPDSAISKSYFDAHKGKNIPQPEGAEDATNLSFTLNRLDQKLDRYQKGDTVPTMNAHLNMNGHKIIYSASPEASNEVCNKEYVDGVTERMCVEGGGLELSEDKCIRLSPLKLLYSPPSGKTINWESSFDIPKTPLNDPSEFRIVYITYKKTNNTTMYGTMPFIPASLPPVGTSVFCNVELFKNVYLTFQHTRDACICSLGGQRGRGDTVSIVSIYGAQ